MAPSFETTQIRFRLGHYAEIALDFDNTDGALSRLTPEHRTLVAHALFHTGDEIRTAAIVTRENHAGALIGVRARCELIAGLLHRKRGERTDADRRFVTSFQLAMDAADPALAAWASLQRFRLRAETEPTGALGVMLEEVRRQAALAADPHVSAYLHDSIALLETSIGRFDEARRHLKICTSLLDQDPNAWLEQVARINAFFIDFVESRYPDALHNLRLARRLMAVTGTRQKSLIDCNEGHVLMALGRFSAAVKRFRELGTSCVIPTALAAIDGLARAHLALDQLGECQHALTIFDQLATNNTSLAASFAVRWTPITRAKLLLRLGHYEEATTQIGLEIQRARALNDKLLIECLACLEAEAYSAAGGMAEAACRLADAGTGTLLSTPDRVGAYYRAVAIVLCHARSALYKSALARAEAIWNQQGNRCAMSEMRHALGKTPGQDCHRGSVRRITNQMTIVSHLGSACGLAHNGRLLGQELLHAIRELKCSSDAMIVDESKSNDHQRQGKWTTLSLGVDGTSCVALVCRIPEDPVKAVLLADILRIGQAAQALERSRQEARNKVAIWSGESVEPEGSGLFIAQEMQKLLRIANRIASSNVPVLITGETGTGKEVLARVIHTYSQRAKSPFLPFNCTATPREMLDSQLFGYRRGSFTGATEHFKGVIRAAAGGTLFLDEIGETSLEVQPKLLRFLEASEVHSIGETHPTIVDVRVIAATNAELDTLVAQGRFREDLFYRLNVLRLRVPPLRERRIEIPALAGHYLRKFALEGRKGDLRLAEETIEYLLLYRWPGNVRQLANEMRRVAALSEVGAVIMPEHLSPEIAASRRTIPPSERLLDPTEVVVRLDQPMPAAIGHLERAMIQYALKQAAGRLEETAARLGVSRKGLYLKRQRYGLDLSPEVAAVDPIAGDGDVVGA